MKKLLLSIPFPRLMVYLIGLGLLPLLYVPYDYSSKLKRIQALEENLQDLQRGAFTKQQKQEVNNIVRSAYAKADPRYLESKLGRVSLLEKERMAYEKLMKECPFPGGSTNETRYKFLTSDENRLLFNPGSTQNKERIEETVETLAHPVEVNDEDLKKILNLIEEKQPGQPELIITDFRLNKKCTPNKREVYELQLQLIKREFLS